MENHLYECLYITRSAIPDTDKFFEMKRYKAKTRATARHAEGQDLAGYERLWQDG
jgi:hypothetical protein